jgi:hypothetical protein
MPKAIKIENSDFLDSFVFLLSNFVRLIVTDVEREAGCGERSMSHCKTGSSLQRKHEK